MQLKFRYSSICSDLCHRAMSALCRRFPEDSTISAAFIHATALHVRNTDTVKKTAKTFLASRKDDLLLWEALGASRASCFKSICARTFDLVFTRQNSGLSLCMCGRREESLEIFSQACMFGAKLAGTSKEVLPRVVLSAVLTGNRKMRVPFAVVKCLVTDDRPQPCIGIGMSANSRAHRMLLFALPAPLLLCRSRQLAPKSTPSCMCSAPPCTC